MQIMVTFIGKESKIDLLIDNRQKIIDTMKTVEEAGWLFTDGEDENYYVKSLRKSRRISAFCSYEEAGIYSGDILKVCGCDI